MCVDTGNLGHPSAMETSRTRRAATARHDLAIGLATLLERSGSNTWKPSIKLPDVGEDLPCFVFCHRAWLALLARLDLADGPDAQSKPLDVFDALVLAQTLGLTAVTDRCLEEIAEECPEQVLQSPDVADSESLPNSGVAQVDEDLEPELININVALSMLDSEQQGRLSKLIAKSEAGRRALLRCTEAFGIPQEPSYVLPPPVAVAPCTPLLSEQCIVDARSNDGSVCNRVTKGSGSEVGCVASLTNSFDDTHAVVDGPNVSVVNTTATDDGPPACSSGDDDAAENFGGLLVSSSDEGNHIDHASNLDNSCSFVLESVDYDENLNAEMASSVGESRDVHQRSVAEQDVFGHGDVFQWVDKWLTDHPKATDRNTNDWQRREQRRQQLLRHRGVVAAPWDLHVGHIVRDSDTDDLVSLEARRAIGRFGLQQIGETPLCRLAAAELRLKENAGDPVPTQDLPRGVGKEMHAMHKRRARARAGSCPMTRSSKDSVERDDSNVGGSAVALEPLRDFLRSLDPDHFDDVQPAVEPPHQTKGGNDDHERGAVVDERHVPESARSADATSVKATERARRRAVARRLYVLEQEEAVAASRRTERFGRRDARLQRFCHERGQSCGAADGNLPHEQRSCSRSRTSLEPDFAEQSVRSIPDLQHSEPVLKGERGMTPFTHAIEENWSELRQRVPPQPQPMPV